jgi:hypothetical protein
VEAALNILQKFMKNFFSNLEGFVCVKRKGQVDLRRRSATKFTCMDVKYMPVLV